MQNGCNKPVLLYEGEELLGAQQNRVLDISILVDAESKTQIPVSCVEAGRWDGRRHRERFRPSPQAADPDLRRKKHRMARERLAVGGEARANQGQVWDEVSERMASLRVESRSEAMDDIYRSRRDQLTELRRPIRRHDRQCGAVVAIAGQIAILDFVGRNDVWSHLHPALLEGYALDALRSGDANETPKPPELSTVRGFTLLATDAPAEDRTASPGLGEAAEGEQMWVFSTQGFYSAVQHRGDPEKVIVRGRTLRDIEALKAQIPTLAARPGEPLPEPAIGKLLEQRR